LIVLLGEMGFARLRMGEWDLGGCVCRWQVRIHKSGQARRRDGACVVRSCLVVCVA
jgi:hypothetical protein